MPVPRKSTLVPNKAKTTKKRTVKKKTPASRAKKGEKLLVTCAPIMPRYLIEEVAESLHGAFFNDSDGRYLQVMAVRIDGHKVYGKCQEMYEQGVTLHFTQRRKNATARRLSRHD